MKRNDVMQAYYIHREITMWENKLKQLRENSEAKASPTYIQGGRSENNRRIGHKVRGNRGNHWRASRRSQNRWKEYHHLHKHHHRFSWAADCVLQVCGVSPMEKGSTQNRWRKYCGRCEKKIWPDVSAKKIKVVRFVRYRCAIMVLWEVRDFEEVILFY